MCTHTLHTFISLVPSPPFRGDPAFMPTPQLEGRRPPSPGWGGSDPWLHVKGCHHRAYLGLRGGRGEES